ncbi:peptidyl-prolyl cis-trans isomerase D-like [Neltuma alba]|uniref:peptidyl-prolyl cis-trans isomerase D-like n=1 Tax=Neltuma alba TaxID=207710 RepID=UPI0010A5270F|nr:peptidyl-prolyl cis-trans isomerase D-like [Prosopis alba]
MAKKKNPRVYMDVSVDKVYVGRMIFELFEDVAPATTENFRALCTGEKGIGPKTGLPLHYKGSFFYRFRRDISYVKGGDLGGRNGTCGESIYGVNFPSENANNIHMRRLYLNMMNEDFLP